MKILLAGKKSNGGLVLNNFETPRIDIALATFNGDRFLSDFFRSLLRQEYLNWRVIIRDDGSSDETPEIIQRWVDNFPDKFLWIKDTKGNLGVCGNFSEIVDYSDAEYVMFADQDDIWLPSKIINAFKKIHEFSENKTQPCLVFCKYKVVDESLVEIVDLNNENNDCVSLRYVLPGNSVPGCTMIINRALVHRAFPIPKEIKIHDWWIVIMAIVFGRVYGTGTYDILYRQHERNLIGYKKKIKFSSRIKKSIESVSYSYVQAFIFSNVSKGEVPDILLKYSRIFELNSFHRFFFLVRNRFVKSSLLKTLVFYTISCIIRRKDIIKFIG